MRLMLLVIIFIVSLIGCKSDELLIISSFSTPPKKYEIPNIQTEKDLIKAYNSSVIKITEWQKWYNIQVSSNYFFYTNN